MKFYVVDASVAVKWLIEEEFSDNASQLFFGQTKLLAPSLIFAEASNALWTMQRKGDLRIDRMVKAIDTLRYSPILIPTSMEQLSKSAIRIAANIDHAVYDCYYLALAIRMDCSVITADKRLFNKVRFRKELSGRVLHVSEVPTNFIQDSGQENAIHEPKAIPFERDNNYGHMRFMYRMDV